jgi:hypothetical protein
VYTEWLAHQKILLAFQVVWQEFFAGEKTRFA